MIDFSYDKMKILITKTKMLLDVERSMIRNIM